MKLSRFRTITTALTVTMLATVAAACSAGGGNAGAEDPPETSAATEEGSEAAPEEMLTWTVGVMPCSTDCGFLRMAQEQGFYEKHGVDVEFVELQSASQIYPALAAGEVDAIEQSPGGLFIAQVTGGLDASVIGSSMDGMPYAIYAKSELESMEDLEGKTMAISSPTGLPALVAQLMVEDAGVDWASMSPVNAGGNADRYRAVVAGTADAASSPADYVPQAETDGVNVLALSTDVIPDYPRYMIIARNDSLAENGEAATRYLAGLIEGLRYAYDNPDEAKQLAADAMSTTPDDEIVTYMHDLIVEKELVDPDAGIDMAKLEFQEEVLRDAGELTADIDLDALVDDSYQQAALEMVEQ
ncbi:ABC transporter substrate-binding protein [Georgenia subflava]|uniref:PhnD/SsuA/transferrin family substrate-binding protein n=1 Tax=Georgenia subflava TaxID=1622177 RepID=A0A6N7EFT9_9MICO|nr:ABC transporter substrate-binding protein [Georgenia subflava]MPV35537.1 PhnD/SsuA/transferrin family substrate-binding protein [Georgenia subflava]